MPVRVKQRVAESSSLSASGKDWEELRKLVTNLVLAWSSHVLIVVRDGVSDRKIQFRGPRSADSLGDLHSETTFVTHVCNTLSQAAFILSPDQSSWVPTSASTSSIRVQGVISREPAPTKAVQFMSLGISPLNVQYGHSFLFDEINRLFENSSFGNDDDSINVDVAERKRRPEHGRCKGEGFTVKQLRGSRKGIDRWPMFYIKVELHDAVTHNVALSAEDLVDDKKGSLSSIMELLQAMIVEFLKSHHFRPTSTRLVNFPQKSVLKRAGSSPEEGDGLSRGTKSGRLSPKPGQMQRLESPFNTWSRVKTGKPKLANSIPEQLCESKNLGSLRKDEANASSTSSNSIRVSSALTSGSNAASGVSGVNSQVGEVQEQRKANSTPKSRTIARSGKVIRPPFNTQQLASLSAKSTHAFSGNETSVLDSNQGDREDNFASWLNPLTRKCSLVNSRTGLVIQPSKIERLTPCILSYLGQDSFNHNICSIPGRVTLMENPKSSENSSTWIREVLRGWNNPVFRPTELAIPQVSLGVPGDELQQHLHGHRHNCSQFEIDRGFQEPSAGLAARISKEDLRQADIISQVDRKFILIKILANTLTCNDQKASVSTETLVIVDQHAADERCRIEDLLNELCKAPIVDQRANPAASLQSGVFTTLLEKPVSFIMPRREIQLLQMHAQHFADWGIIFNLAHLRPKLEEDQEQKVTVVSLPPCIIERCISVPRLLVELLRSESWKCIEKEPKLDANIVLPNGTDPSMKHSWLRKIHSCPQALLEMLNSRACRSKIHLSLSFVRLAS